MLILSGRQDPGGYQHLSDLLSVYPRGTCAILDRAGHLLFAEQPTLLAALGTEWLDRVEEYLRLLPKTSIDAAVTPTLIPGVAD